MSRKGREWTFGAPPRAHTRAWRVSRDRYLPTPGALLRWANAGDDRYRGARLGFGLAGPHLVPGLFPLPVRITHVVSEPLELGDRSGARGDPRAFETLHEELTERCQKLLDVAVVQRDVEDDPLDRAIRRAQGLLQRLGL